MAYAYDFWVPSTASLPSVAFVVLFFWLVAAAPAALADRTGRALTLVALAVAAVLTQLPWTGTNLQEGTQLDVIRAVRGESGHAGLAQVALTEWWMGSTRQLPRLVGLHAGLSAAVGLVGAAALRRRPVVAAALLWGWLASTSVRFGVTSEGPGPLASLFLAVVLSAASTARARPWHLAVVLASGGLAMLTRTELVVVPIAALAALAVERTSLPTRVEGYAAASAERWRTSALRTRVEGAVWLVAAVVVAVAIHVRVDLLPTAERASWVAHALHPFDPSKLLLPVQLASAWPLGIAAAATAGLCWSIRHPVRSLGLGPVFLGLNGLYFVAAHGRLLGYGSIASTTEWLRYHTHLPVLVVALAWLGFDAVGPRTRRALLLTCLVPPLPALVRAMPWTLTHATWTVSAPPLADAQLDGAGVARVLAEHGACGLLVRDHPPRGGGPPTWLGMLGPDAAAAHTARHGLGDHVRIQEIDGALSVLQAADALPTAPSCVLLYQGQGCLGSQVCEADRAGRETVWSDVVPVERYTHPAHRLPFTGELPRRLVRIR
jgi:hypothetical protein